MITVMRLYLWGLKIFPESGKNVIDRGNVVDSTMGSGWYFAVHVVSYLEVRTMGRTSTQERVFGAVGQAARKMSVEDIFRALGGRVTLSGVRTAIAGLHAGTGWSGDQSVLDPEFRELLSWVRGFLPVVAAEAGGRDDLISAVRAARAAALADLAKATDSASADATKADATKADAAQVPSKKK